MFKSSSSFIEHLKQFSSDRQLINTKLFKSPNDIIKIKKILMIIIIINNKNRFSFVYNLLNIP